MTTLKKIPKPKFDNCAQYVRDARDYIPRVLGLTDEAPWTQAKLADLIGVDPNYIGIIERGEKEPSQHFRNTLVYIFALAENKIDPRDVLARP